MAERVSGTVRETEIEKACVNAREHLKKRQDKKAEVIDPDSWRDGYKSKTQLTTEEPQFLIDKLIPEGALTFITAGSYNCKTWLAMAAMKPSPQVNPCGASTGHRNQFQFATTSLKWARHLCVSVWTPSG